jgi:hypothetical protein
MTRSVGITCCLLAILLLHFGYRLFSEAINTQNELQGHHNAPWILLFFVLCICLGAGFTGIRLLKR